MPHSLLSVCGLLQAAKFLNFQFNLARKINVLKFGVNKIVKKRLWKPVDECGKNLKASTLAKGFDGAIRNLDELADTDAKKGPSTLNKHSCSGSASGIVTPTWIRQSRRSSLQDSA